MTLSKCHRTSRSRLVTPQMVESERLCTYTGFETNPYTAHQFYIREIPPPLLLAKSHC